LTEDKIIEKIKKEKPSEKMLTQRDLTKFKKEIDALLETRFSDFVDGFLEAWSDAQKDCEEDNEKCTCPECSGEHETENPAKYVIFSGGNKFFATDIKPNALVGIDFYLHEVDKNTGREYNSQGTITSPDVVILDLMPEMTLDMFSSIKRNTLDYVVQQAQEARAKEKAIKAAQSETMVDTSSHVSYG
jgi:hypothetical protein